MRHTRMRRQSITSSARRIVHTTSAVTCTESSLAIRSSGFAAPASILLHWLQSTGFKE